MAAFVVTIGCACGGRPPAPGLAFFGADGGDDGSAYGGVIPALDVALPPPVDATVSAPSPQAIGGDDAAVLLPYGDDAASDASGLDDGDDGGCTAEVAPGVLRIDELMIESVDGTGDHGEWLEVANTSACAVDLRGLHGDCPHGAKAATFDVAGDVWVPAGASFVVADSVSPAIDHDVPLPVVAWQGNLGDVLRNKGTTVTLSLNDVVIDTLTYPALALTVGTSLEFPANCDPSQRDDFSRWQPAQSSWFPGFHGTPNGPNTDVSCPM